MMDVQRRVTAQRTAPNPTYEATTTYAGRVNYALDSPLKIYLT